MKASRAEIERALDAAPLELRFFLLHGPDESQSRELAGRIAKSLGPDAERIDLSGAALKADPARLADEAASLSLFGGRRHIRVEPAGDEIIEAIEALMEAPSAGNPVAIVAGALRKDSKLLKRALADPAALAFASYPPDGSDADQLAAAIARAQGLRLEPDVAQLLAIATGGDRALLAREIEKLALFVDAAADRPATLDRDTYMAISADTGDGDVGRLIDMVLSGRLERLPDEIARLAANGIDGIAILRPLLRRLLMLAQYRAQLDRGGSAEAAVHPGRGMSFKEKTNITNQGRRWSAAALAKAIERAGTAERAVKSSGSAGAVLVEVELLAIARATNRMR